LWGGCAYRKVFQLLVDSRGLLCGRGSGVRGDIYLTGLNEGRFFLYGKTSVRPLEFEGIQVSILVRFGTRAGRGLDGN
jgi:hypothetical protein